MAIGNANGQVVVDIAQDREKLTIKITDNGGGFSETFLQQGIRPFVSLKEKGSGLGLVMVQRFVRDQHGQLKLDNTADGQGQVSLTLPIASQSAS